MVMKQFLSSVGSKTAHSTVVWPFKHIELELYSLLGLISYHKEINLLSMS